MLQWYNDVDVLNVISVNAVNVNNVIVVNNINN